MKSAYSNGNIFTDVKVEKFPRHLFDKSFTTSFTANHGLLYPHFVKDVIPGDRFDLHTYGRVQLQPLATASMQNIRAYMRYFYIPYRLIWDKWDEFISQDGFTDVPILAPYIELNSDRLNQLSPNDLIHYLGVRTANFKANGSPLEYEDENTRCAFTLFRLYAYYLIWDTYFRDENLISSIFEYLPELDEGDMTNLFFPGSAPRLKRFSPIAYEKDYFTTALPWQQKGQPVNLSSYLSVGSLPINFYLSDITTPGGGLIGDRNVHSIVMSKTQQAGSPSNLSFEDFSVRTQISAETIGTYTAQLNGDADIPAQSLSTSFNINDLRYSNALQRYLERLALGGNRPAEFYLSMYGVKIDDLRIGQPLYLGGGYEYIHVTPVTQQSETATTPQGTLAGNGSSSPSFGINHPYTADEFGIVMGVFYLRPEINYTQGVDKELQLFNHLEYYNPVFAHLGEEAVKKSELIFVDGMVNREDDPNYNDPTFGYQSRYAYLKHSRNEVHGDLVSDLSHWLLSAHFSPDVQLNSDFISVDQNYSIFATADKSYDHYICEFHHDFKVESSMPDFSIPSL